VSRGRRAFWRLRDIIERQVSLLRRNEGPLRDGPQQRTRLLASFAGLEQRHIGTTPHSEGHSITFFSGTDDATCPSRDLGREDEDIAPLLRLGNGGIASRGAPAPTPHRDNQGKAIARRRNRRARRLHRAAARTGRGSAGQSEGGFVGRARWPWPGHRPLAVEFSSTTIRPLGEQSRIRPLAPRRRRSHRRSRSSGEGDLEELGPSQSRTSVARGRCVTHE